MKFRDSFFVVANLMIFVSSLVTDWYRPLTIAVIVLLIIMILDRLGKGLVLRELMALHAVFICLFMPYIGYTVYTFKNPLSRLWVRYMDIPEETYFGFALPAMVAFVLVSCWPLSNAENSDMGESFKKVVERAKTSLVKIPYIGLYLMIFGVGTYAVSNLLPAELQFAFTLFYFASFTGFLYIYYQKNLPFKNIILVAFSAYIFSQSLASGMFTIVAYMGLTIFSFLFLGRRLAFWKKASYFALGIVLLFLIQSVKVGYRTQTWKNNYEGNKFGLFLELATKQIFESPSGDDLSVQFFPIYYRSNQGYNIMLVMKRFPDYIEFDQGSRLFNVILSSFVPRIFWSDKPTAGGKYNMKYYAGVDIDGWSTNVGPLGEAYGSFGSTGGILYMIFLGWIIRWPYALLMRISRKYPLLLFWVPVIFYQVTYSAESDTLQIVNSVTKSAFFVWILFRFFPKIFGVEKDFFGKLKSN